MRVHVIQDPKGTIIGTITAGVTEVRTTQPGVQISDEDANEEVLQVEVVPEPRKGQTIYEVELPPELEKLEDAADLLKALSEYRIASAEVKLVRR